MYEMIANAWKKCSVILQDIGRSNLEDSQLPSVTKMTSVLKTVDGKVKTLDSYLWNGLKRKLQTFTEKEQTDEPPAKKKIVKIISSDSEEETDELPPKKKIVKIISDSKEEANVISDEDSGFKDKSNDASEDSGSEEETENESDIDADEDYKPSFGDVKNKNNKKVKEEKKSDKNFKKEKYVPQIKRVKKSAYELMIEKKRIERLALLESLKMEEVKSDFSATVNSLASSVKKTKPKPTKSFKRTIQRSHSPIRRSKRLANVSVDLSEDKLYDKAVENAAAETKASISIPSELSFSEALSSEELYETYVKDVNIEEQKHLETNYVSYNRSILQNLNLDDNNIAKVVPVRITALSWYPSANDLILAAGSKYGDIGIWNVASESDPHVFKIHNEGITNALFNPFNAAELLTSSYEGTLRCGDMVKHVFNEVYNTESCCTYFDILSSTTYLVGLRNGQVTLVDKRSSKPCAKNHLCHDYSIKSVSIHPVNRNMFVTAENKGSVRLWDLRKLQKDPVADITHHKRCVNSAFFSPVTGNSILTTSFDDSICIFDSTNLTQDIKVTRQMKHNNQTGRWLTIFRATWLPNSDEIFAVGSVANYPRVVQLYDKDLKVCHLLRHDNLTTITSINIFHPFRPALAGSNSSGKVFVFT